MKARKRYMALGALLAGAAIGLGWIAWRQMATPGTGGTGSRGPDLSGRTPLPPDPSRSFRDHTPEQRIEEGSVGTAWEPVLRR